MSTIKNLLFDLGGVIIDINRDNAIKKFKEIGVDDIEKYLDPYKQSGIFLELEDGKLSREEFYEAVIKLTGKNISDKDIDQGWLDFLLPVKQEKLDMILEWRKTYNVYLLSNTNPIIMGWANTPAFSPAGKPLDYYFDDLFLSYELGYVKPDIEIYHKVIELSGMVPEETLFIDDGKANIEAGNSLGFQTFWFKEGSTFSQIKEML